MTRCTEGELIQRHFDAFNRRASRASRLAFTMSRTSSTWKTPTRRCPVMFFLVRRAELMAPLQ